MNIFWGLCLAFVIATPAWFLGRAVPIVGGPVFGIFIGIVVAALWNRPVRFEAGLKFTTKKVLQAAIVLLGFEMNLFSVLRVGGQSLVVMLFTLSAAFLTAWGLSRILGLRGKMPLLIGVGTAICGGSAIAATAPVVQASDDEVSHAISTIFLFNVLAVFLFPVLGHLLSMSDSGFGLWAGTAVNDTSSVVATGLAFSDAALEYATIVKLTRTLLIIPIVLILAAYTARRQRGGEGGASTPNSSFSFSKIFPWFVLGFLAAAIIATVGVLPDHSGLLLAASGKFLIVVAMSAIGLNTDIKKLVHNGWRPIILGLGCWFAVAVTSLIAQIVAGLW